MERGEAVANYSFSSEQLRMRYVGCNHYSLNWAIIQLGTLTCEFVLVYIVLFVRVGALVVRKKKGVRLHL